MMAVLLMVGRGEEAPSLVRTLLDVAATPRKPQYNMASGEGAEQAHAGGREGCC